MAAAEGKAKDVASNRRSKDVVRAIRNLTPHVTVVVCMDTQHVIVGAMSGRFETPQATGGTRKGNAQQRCLTNTGIRFLDTIT